MRYKIKKRYNYERLPTGFYVYSRTFTKNKNGNMPFRRRRISGVFKTRKEAQAMAGMLALSLNGMKKAVKKYPKMCVKTKGRATQKAICIRCRRACSYAGRPRIRKSK